MFFGSSYIRRFISTLLISSVGIYGCTTEEKFESIDKNFAGPVDVVSIGSYAYVLNSDFDRRYNSGSIVTLDPSQSGDARKLSSHIVPRLGRSLYAKGQVMLATFDRVDLESEGAVEIYSVDASGIVSTAFSQKLDCSPVAGTISQSQDWAVVTCISGEVYIAPLDVNNLGATNFRFVRNYRYTRRALHIYEDGTNSYLLAFPTDVGQQTSGDFVADDVDTYNKQFFDSNSDGLIRTEGVRNEVPDTFENTVSNIRQFSARFPYQVAILNLTASQANGFVFKDVVSASESDDTIVLGTNGATVYKNANNELKFIYFTLPVSGNEPATSGGSYFYRTNFWEAKQGQAGNNEIILSHRGLYDTNDSNNILKLTIQGAGVFSGPSDSTPQPFANQFSQMFKVDRLMGTSAVAKSGYPGDFEYRNVNNTGYLFVNQFRDEAYWDASSRLYAVDVKEVGSVSEGSKLPVRWQGLDFRQSAFELSVVGADVNSPSHLVSCSFYGDSVLVFPINQADGIDTTGAAVTIAEPAVIF